MNKRGFTLVELLIVIAIIGIISSIVVSNLGDARGNAGDAAGQATLASARSEAEIFFISDGGNAYTGLCADSPSTEFYDLVLEAQQKTDPSASDVTAQCAASANSYIAYIELEAYDGATDFSVYCIDSGGYGGNPGISSAPDATLEATDRCAEASFTS